MMPLKKLIITPYFGQFPEWFHKFEPPAGYDWLLDVNFNGFKKRVKERFGIEYPGTWGSTKVWDYRCAFGLLYAEELEGYDYWSHMDFDMVFGDVNKWFPDEEIEKLDIWSNHGTYICGPWTLYRNDRMINNLFLHHPDWKKLLLMPESTGWVEEGYSRIVEQSGLKYKYSFMQGDPYNPPFKLKKEGIKLWQETNEEWQEIAMLHFRRDKKWPLNP